MKGKKNKKLLIIITILIFLLFTTGVFLAIYAAKSTIYFLKGTTVNGQDVSGMPVKRVVELLIDDFYERDIKIIENEQAVLVQKTSALGTIDQQKLTQQVKKYMEKQRENIFSSFVKANNYEVEIPYAFSVEAYQTTVSDAGLFANRTASQDAALVFNGEIYQITPEVYGNEFDIDRLQNFVKSSLEKMVKEQKQSKEFCIEITKDLYKQPTIFQDDEELVTQMNVWNQFCLAKIEYVFGEQKEVVDWNTIQTWITIENGSGVLNEEAVKKYVEELATQYNTIYRKRTIMTSHGYEKELVSNDYGYKVDYDGEVSQLIADIKANAPVSREPIYSKRGYSRNGKDDVNGTYVEVDLTNQHLWFYKNSQLIVETDIVTGKPSYQETAQGAFPIAYKASPFNLKGGGSNGTKSWDVQVDYWMPFHDGQGLHDASWKSAFGGNIYLTNGSHGCINLPKNAAKKIYENIEALVPIFLYK